MGEGQAPTNHKERFDVEAVRKLAEQIRAGHAALDGERLVATATSGLTELEMEDRVKLFASAMEEQLPADRVQALAAITASLPPPLQDCEGVADGWRKWPVGQWIAQLVAPGASEAITEAAMDTMVELTRRFTSAFAVRIG